MSTNLANQLAEIHRHLNDLHAEHVAFHAKLHHDHDVISTQVDDMSRRV